MRVARPPATDEAEARRRRMGLVVAATIAVLAIAIAAFPLMQEAREPGALEGPAIVPRPIVVATLLGLPSVLAVIAAIQGSRPIFVAAGVLCLFQSFIAFSGVTLGFVLPGCVLIGLGLSRSRTQPANPLRRRGAFAGLLVVALGIGAWLVPFATSETVCWTARVGPDGDPVYTLIPDTGTVTLQLDSAGGCDGGAFTLQGLMVAGVLAISALAMAGLAGVRPRAAREPPA